MNSFRVKVFLLALVACCQLVACDIDLDEEKEIGLLLGHERLFSQYCLSVHENIVSDLKQRSRDSSSAVFNIFFGAAADIATETLEVQQGVVKTLASQLQLNNQEETDDNPLPENKILELVEEGKEAMANRVGPIGRLLEATKTASKALVGAANSALFSRLAKARAKMTGTSLLTGILNTCTQIDQYKADMDTNLSKTKKELVAEHSADQEIVDFVNKMTSANLKCNTTKFITNLNFFCHMFRDGKGFFLKMLGAKEPEVPTVVRE